MKFIFLILIFFFFIENTKCNRIRLCISTTNIDKLKTQCVHCSNKLISQTFEFCTGNDDYSTNITFDQAKCLINLCKKQLPVINKHIPEEIFSNEALNVQNTIDQQKKWIKNKFQKPNTFNQNQFSINHSSSMPSYSITNAESIYNQNLNNNLSDFENENLGDFSLITSNKLNDYNGNLYQTNSLTQNKVSKPEMNFFSTNKQMIKRKPFRPTKFWSLFFG